MTQVDSVISQINTWKQCWVEREVCREVYAPVPVTPEDTGNARRAALLTRATSSHLLPTRVVYFTRTPVFVNTGRNIPGPLVSVFKVSYYCAS